MRSARSARHASVIGSGVSPLRSSSNELVLADGSAAVRQDYLQTNLKEFSSLRLPFSSSSELVLLMARLLLAARDDGAELGVEEAGEPFFDLALRDTVLPLSRACRRRSCMM